MIIQGKIKIIRKSLKTVRIPNGDLTDDLELIMSLHKGKFFRYRRLLNNPRCEICVSKSNKKIRRKYKIHLTNKVTEKG